MIPKKLGNTSFVFEHKMPNQKEKVVCEVKITKVMIDLMTRKSKHVIEEIARHFRRSVKNK